MEINSRLFELRTYTANEGKLDDLLSRFENHTIRLFEIHGMKVEGFWIPVENPDKKLVYMLSYSSLEAREQSWENFQNDPEWIAARDASNLNGDLLANKESVYLKATGFSPLQ